MRIAAEKALLWDKNTQTYTVKPAILRIGTRTIASIDIFEDTQTFQEANRRKAPQHYFNDTKLLTPAFVNAHTHLTMNFFRNMDSLLAKASQGNMMEDFFFVLEKRLTPDHVRAFTRMGAYESLQSGVGLVWDHYFFGKAIAEGLRDSECCGVVAPTLQDLSGPGVEQLNQTWQDTEDLLQPSWTDQGVFAAVGPHATNTVSPELWEQSLAFAQTHNIPLHFHLAQSSEEYEFIQKHHKQTPTKFLDNLGILRHNAVLGVHGIYLTHNDLKILSTHQTTLGFCPFSQMIFQFPAQVFAWEKAKIPWILATDCVASNDSMNLQKEMRYAAGFALQAITFGNQLHEFRTKNKKSSLPVEKARQKIWKESLNFRDPSFLLDRVFRIPGNLHPQIKAGLLAPNYLANLLVWDLDHPSFWPGDGLRALAFGDTTQAIDQMMTNGRWIGTGTGWQETLLKSSEYRDALNEAKKLLSTL